ncbi:MAG: phosphoribosylformylglycinamidine synthase subunit PurS [Acidobacteriota bacterium]
MKARVVVRLKPEVHDPQGETIRGTLEALGYGKVQEVRQGKTFELSLQASSREEAEAMARDIAERVLANPVLETFEVELHD